jgi:hypothetical protein
LQKLEKAEPLLKCGSFFICAIPAHFMAILPSMTANQQNNHDIYQESRQYLITIIACRTVEENYVIRILDNLPNQTHTLGIMQ